MELPCNLNVMKDMRLRLHVRNLLRERSLWLVLSLLLALNRLKGHSLLLVLNRRNGRSNRQQGHSRLLVQSLCRGRSHRLVLSRRLVRNRHRVLKRLQGLLLLLALLLRHGRRRLLMRLRRGGRRSIARSSFLADFCGVFNGGRTVRDGLIYGATDGDLR